MVISKQKTKWGYEIDVPAGVKLINPHKDQVLTKHDLAAYCGTLSDHDAAIYTRLEEVGAVTRSCEGGGAVTGDDVTCSVPYDYIPVKDDGMVAEGSFIINTNNRSVRHDELKSRAAYATYKSLAQASTPQSLKAVIQSVSVEDKTVTVLAPFGQGKKSFVVYPTLSFTGNDMTKFYQKGDVITITPDLSTNNTTITFAENLPCPHALQDGQSIKVDVTLYTKLPISCLGVTYINNRPYPVYVQTGGNADSYSVGDVIKDVSASWVEGRGVCADIVSYETWYQYAEDIQHAPVRTLKVCAIAARGGCKVSDTKCPDITMFVPPVVLRKSNITNVKVGDVIKLTLATFDPEKKIAHFAC